VSLFSIRISIVIKDSQVAHFTIPKAYFSTNRTHPSASLPKTYPLELAVIHDVQQISLFSHLQFTGSFRHIGQIIVPHPTHVLSALLQAQ
jgi:hypothetical protein